MFYVLFLVELLRMSNICFKANTTFQYKISMLLFQIQIFKCRSFFFPFMFYFQLHILFSMPKFQIIIMYAFKLLIK